MGRNDSLRNVTAAAATTNTKPVVAVVVGAAIIFSKVLSTLEMLHHVLFSTVCSLEVGQ